MTVAVVGPGAVGMTLAVGLAEAGQDVVLCGRTPVEAVTLTEDEHGTRTRPTRFVSDPAQVGRVDRVLPDDDAGRAAAELFGPTWIRTETVPDFRTAAWRKLLTNVAANPITALTGRRVEVLLEPAVAGLALEVLRETVEVGRAEGADLPDGTAEDTLAWLQALPAGSTSSMLQDRAAGRPLEHDGLTGAVVRLADRRGIDAPANRALLALTAALT